MTERFPELDPGGAATLATIHAYALAMAAVPRAHAAPHPRWWHIGLRVEDGGLDTTAVPISGGGELRLRMDLYRHQVVLIAPEAEHRFEMGAGLTASELGDRIITIADSLGLRPEYDQARFANDESRRYEPAVAATYRDALHAAAAVFGRYRTLLGDRVSPILVWPHEFDISFECYGTRTVSWEGAEHPTQVNLGFYPAGDPYFYSSPWPFESGFLAAPLPHGAVWNATGWTGARLPYSAARGEDGAEIVIDFARAVLAAAGPALGIPSPPP